MSEMGCSHCMVNALPDGSDMSIKTYERVLEFTEEVDIKTICITGGEPTEHPGFVEYVKIAQLRGFLVLVMSNGMFLEDEKKKDEVLGLGVPIQITNDSRYYPLKVPIIDHPNLTYEHNIRVMTAMGRAIGRYESTKNSPMCINLRLVLRQTRDLRESILALRKHIKMCSPSIDYDGTIRAGESNLCYKLGDIWSRIGVIAHGIMNIDCNKCGCEGNLPDDIRGFVGIKENSDILS